MIYRNLLLNKVVKTKDSPATVLIRLLVAFVFFPEGIQKLIFPAILGSGRFTQIGIPYPDVMAPFVGITEITCGLLILFGLATRLAAIPLIIIMVVAIISTKIPILLGHDWWIFHVAKFSRYGFWSMMHEIRADSSMFLASLYLLIRGGGQWSIDAWIETLSSKTKAAGNVLSS
jgi:putative oxidoreductase